MASETQTCAISILANQPNAIRYTLYASRDTRHERPIMNHYSRIMTPKSRSLKPDTWPLNPDHWSIMQNKPNFRKARMNANFCFRKDYENVPASAVQENKPNQTQFP